MTNEKVKITITDDNHRVFDINEIPVSIDAIVEHLAYVGRWVGAVPNSDFNLGEHLKTNDYPLVGWSSYDAGVFMKAYVDKNGVETIEYNVKLSEEIQRYAIVYGIVGHELGYFKNSVMGLKVFKHANPNRREIHEKTCELLLPHEAMVNFILRSTVGSSEIVKSISEHFKVPLDIVSERLTIHSLM